ncbi:MAG: transaldolase [Campylobacteraceae bacterium]|jgi:twitching motility protein PilT|nr:transaldolase [Campylobacteraceae bacterium]
MSFYQNNFSIWCDFIERDFLKSDFLEFLESEAVVGITSNPTIFRNSIKNSGSYESDKEETLHLSAKERYEYIAVKDIREAANTLLSLYELGDDGLVSIEVSPRLANDVVGTIEEGKRLFKEINRPNVMIKIPATKAGYIAIEELISEGINVNATLVFSPKQSEECLRAIKQGNKKFLNKNPKAKLPRAVISVFVSRFDRKLDEIFKKKNLPTMTFGIMNASYIYNEIEELNLPNTRCLFASTGVSNKNINEAYYINELMYKNAINTAPLSAINAFISQGDFDELVPPNKDDIVKYFSEVGLKGIDVEKVYEELLSDGLKQFEDAFDEILKLLETKNQNKEKKQVQKNKDVVKESTEEIVFDEELFKKIHKEIEKEQDLPDYAKRLKNALAQLVANNGSDLHIKSNAVIKGRVYGEIVTLDNKPVFPGEMEALAQYLLDGTTGKILKSKGKYDKFLLEKNIDFTFKLNDDYRFRVNMFFQIDGISAAFRTIPTKLPTVDSLELPEILNSFAQKQRGLILVTGPTGCGKSTTLATMLNFINQTSQKHIITIEDPVEFIYKEEQSIVNQRAVGESVTTFSNALVAALREDPDVIMVGEMRDLETIRTAIRAAETGHLVLSTLHTLDAKETISRIISMFDGNEQAQIRKSLSSVLQAIVSQRLVRRKERGRIAAVEIMVKNDRIEALIADTREYEILDAIEEGKSVYKSQSFNQALLDLYAQDKISYYDALRAATSPSDLQILLDNHNAYKNKVEKIEQNGEFESSDDLLSLKK